MDNFTKLTIGLMILKAHGANDFGLNYGEEVRVDNVTDVDRETAAYLEHLGFDRSGDSVWFFTP